ncbi:MAG: hypothetical protein J4G03_01465 [Gemmatimonadetes bacterium]|nr:hypothetical protein [Gemmatimonadota bacterium]
MNVLFVCTGNTCRSPLAEATAKHQAARRGLKGIFFRSAGVFAADGFPASGTGRAAAALRGLDLDEHGARQLTPEICRWADRVVTMGSGHADQVRAMAPDATVAVITEYLPGGHPRAGRGVPDPFGGNLGQYVETLDLVETAAGGLLDDLFGARAARYVLLGDPVEHSVSPEMHEAVFRAWGLDATFESVRVSARAASEAMRDSRLRGGNVTLPHKKRAAEVLDHASEAVRATGVCNCWRRSSAGLLYGENTDVGGLRRALEDAGFGAPGQRVLLLGAGGAARAALETLVQMESASVDVLNRTPERARAMVNAARAARAAPAGPDVRVIESAAASPGWDLAVNATSLGLSKNDPLPLDPAAVKVGSVYDLVYAPGATALVRRAVQMGIPARDGVGMLVSQAVLSLRFWMPGREPPRAVMQQSATRALAARAARRARAGRG